MQLRNSLNQGYINHRPDNTFKHSNNICGLFALWEQ